MLVHPYVGSWFALCLLPFLEEQGNIQVLALGILICCFLQRLDFSGKPCKYLPQW